MTIQFFVPTVDDILSRSKLQLDGRRCMNVHDKQNYIQKSVFFISFV